MSKWNEILDREQLDAQYALSASLDPGFAKRQRAFYDAQSADQLSALMHQSWLCNDPDGYQLARSHRALLKWNAK